MTAWVEIPELHRYPYLLWSQYMWQRELKFILLVPFVYIWCHSTCDSVSWNKWRCVKKGEKLCRHSTCDGVSWNTLKLIISLKGKVQYMWRRELKCIKAAKKQLVTVHVTAWVEIKDIRSRNPVTVHVTAWVERLAPYAESQHVVVTVHVTAWVEMEWLNSYLRHQSHSTCDSVSWKRNTV